MTATVPDDRPAARSGWASARIWIGVVIFLAASAFLLSSHYVSRFRSCTGSGSKHTCSPLQIGDVAPLLVFGAALAIPTWTDLSIGGLGLKRELEQTRAVQKELQQTVELRIVLGQLQSEVTDIGATTGTEPAALDRAKEEALNAARRSVMDVESRLSKLTAVSPVVAERAKLARRALDLSERLPDSVSVQELRDLEHRAREVASLLDGSATPLTGD